jgi:hypothetical protein
MWPKKNMGMSQNSVPKIPGMGNPTPAIGATAPVKPVGIPSAMRSPLPSEQPIMHMLPQHMNTNPMMDKSRMFNNLKSFLDKNKLPGKV